MTLRERLSSLLEPRRRPWIYVPVAAALAMVFLTSNLLLGAFIAAFLAFAIPYLMGERRPRNLILAGLVILLVTGVALAALLTWNAYQPYEPVQESDDGVLTAGTVEPLFGDAQTLFTFRVTYTGSDPPEDGPRVHIVSTALGLSQVTNLTMAKEDPLDEDYRDGVTFFVTTKLPEGSHSFHFAVLTTNGSWVKTSDLAGVSSNSFGPLNMPPVKFFFNLVPGVVLYVFALSGLPLILVIGLYSWRSRVRQRFAESVTRKCPQCGGAISEGDKVCPSCGQQL